MKYINWLIGSLLTLAFLSCMDDKGSYDYTKLDEPVWKLREGSNTIWVECRAGEMAKFKSTPFFTWQGDSAARAAGVRYEWKVNGVVLINSSVGFTGNLISLQWISYSSVFLRLRISAD